MAQPPSLLKLMIKEWSMGIDWRQHESYYSVPKQLYERLTHPERQFLCLKSTLPYSNHSACGIQRP